MIKVEEVVYGQRKVIVILFIVFFSMLFMHTYMALFPMGLLLIIGFVFFRKPLSMRKFGKMKLYSNSGDVNRNSYNESLSVEDNGYTLQFKAMGMQFFDNRNNEALSQQGAAEYYWSIFIKPLQD